ncbi:VanZ family protein [Citrifermentans bremense]|uniref:VanZ family protein n=1 Tax=Citrifermentans bremense TaxID=60035 RepID=A0A6S6M872_9BACT|nr:VanZ family protein [Citrifermentans bremense]BCG47625.1 VanZ family protein [Citrifermentans bremense]
MNRKALLATLICVLLIAYASLFPLSGWRLPGSGFFAWCTLKLPGHVSKSDLLVNVIAYVPLGYLLFRLFRVDKRPAVIALACALVTGSALSFAMELTQTALPGRTPSTVDLGANTLGACAGALLALIWQRAAMPQGALSRWRASFLAPGREGDLGLAVLLLWLCSQWAPFVPSLDWGGIKNGLKPLWYTANDLSRLDLMQGATYFCYLAALGVLAQETLRRRALALPLFSLFAALVLCGKIFILGRQLSLEALAGLFAAVPLLAVAGLLGEKSRRLIGCLLLVTGFALYELKPGAGGLAGGFGWVPFQGQLAHELTGFGSILEGVWPFAALWILIASVGGETRGGAWPGAAAVFAFVLALEWLQLEIPGRTPDLTQALLALAGWLAPAFYLRGAPPRAGA